ncbi:MAG: CRISPR-associated endonuclease Cas6 [Candidatus Aminicenantes bacterium]|nr:CRISPR-associated endonuclease Cas6 [Candidatus Aminicenantes bacterium]
MLQLIKTGVMKFPGICIPSSLLHKVRGYFSRQFVQFDLLHNHEADSDRVIYRYPAVQFKIHDCLAIHAYKAEGIGVLKELFLEAENIVIEGRVLAVNSKEIEVSEVEFGEDGETYVYEFVTPWIALNQQNYKEFLALETDEQRKEKLHAILINNIISFCKFAGYTVEERLVVKSNFNPVSTNLKGKTHLAFTGEFMVNFRLPDLLGLGKSTSRGYGNVLRKI